MKKTNRHNIRNREKVSFNRVAAARTLALALNIPGCIKIYDFRSCCERSFLFSVALQQQSMNKVNRARPTMRSGIIKLMVIRKTISMLVSSIRIRACKYFDMQRGGLLCAQATTKNYYIITTKDGRICCAGKADGVTPFNGTALTMCLKGAKVFVFFFFKRERPKIVK